MKHKLLAFIMIMATILSMTGCNPKEELDTCEPVIREYLDAKTEAEQAAILERSSGTNLARQSLSFSWESDGSKKYKVYFANNKNYENPWIYESSVDYISPDGIFIPGETYYWKVESGNDGSVIHEAAFTTTDAPVRFITTSQVPNVRDLGGWKTADGKKQIKYGMLYRGGMTNPSGGNVFPEQDVILFRDTLGIRTEIDLRTPNKDDKNQTVSILGENASYHKLPLDGYCCIIPGFMQSYPVGRVYSPTNTESIQEIFHILADEKNYPIYFHCNAGADRTGTIAYLVCGVLGVSYEDLTRDFELTSFSPAGRRWRSAIVGGNAFDDTGVMQDDAENYVAWGKMNRLMMEQYGGGTLQEAIEKYLITACGVPKEEIESIRNILLEK